MCERERRRRRRERKSKENKKKHNKVKISSDRVADEEAATSRGRINLHVMANDIHRAAFASIPFNINYLSGHKLLTRFAARIASPAPRRRQLLNIAHTVSLRLRLL